MLIDEIESEIRQGRGERGTKRTERRFSECGRSL
jgi:hypothetical protein